MNRGTAERSGLEPRALPTLRAKLNSLRPMNLTEDLRVRRGRQEKLTRVHDATTQQHITRVKESRQTRKRRLGAHRLARQSAHGRDTGVAT